MIKLFNSRVLLSLYLIFASTCFCTFSSAKNIFVDSKTISYDDNSNESGQTPATYFLTPKEISESRGQIPRNEINPYTLSGNSVNLLVDGEEFFASLYKDLLATQSGDYIWMTAWDINPEVMLSPNLENLKQAEDSKIKNVLRNAIKRNVEVRILINFTISNPLKAKNFCAPLNEAAGKVVCAPDQRHNSNVGNLHQKSWVIKRNNETIAYVGSTDIMDGRYDTPKHDRDDKFLSQPQFFQGYYGWTEGMLLVKGPAAADVAMHLYHQITDPVPPFPSYRLSPIQLPDFSIKHYDNSTTQVQTLISAGPAGATEYGYYSNWAPYGETTVLAGTLKAIKQAKHYIFISDQLLWYAPILNAIAEQLPYVEAVVLVTNGDKALDQTVSGYSVQTASNAKSYYQNQAWKALENSPKVFGYQLIKEGLESNNTHHIIYTHWKVLLIDDEFAIIGSTGVERSGMTNDLDLSLGIYDPALVKDMRIKLWSEHLNIPYPNHNMEDPVQAIYTMWTSEAAANGRVRPFWPADVPYWSVYSIIYNFLEPCGFTNSKLCK